MKKFIIYLEYHDTRLLKGVLKLLEEDKYSYIEWHFIVDELPSVKEIVEIHKLLDVFSKQKDIVCKKYIACSLKDYARKSLKTIKKNGFHMEVTIKDNIPDINVLKIVGEKLVKSKVPHKYIADVPLEEQMNIYFIFAEIGLPLNLRNINYSDEMITFFDKWIIDKKAVPLNSYNFVLRSILLNDNTHNCRYNSCLGKNVYINKDGDISFCIHFPDKTRIGNTYNNTCLGEIYHGEQFLDILKNATAHRSKCIETCEKYSYCQGGCPLECDDCTNHNYIKLVEHVKEELLQVISLNNLNKYNSCVKSAVYDSLAFNGTFNIK